MSGCAACWSIVPKPCAPRTSHSFPSLRFVLLSPWLGNPFSLTFGLHSLFSYLSLHYLVAHLGGLEQLLIANDSIWKVMGSAGWLSTAVKEWLELHRLQFPRAGHPWGSVTWLSVGGLLGAQLGCQGCSCGLCMRLGAPRSWPLGSEKRQRERKT